MEQETIIESLLNEYIEHRTAIKAMILDLEKIKAKVDTLFPDSLDKRYIRFFEEKIKSTTALFGSLLDMRREIARSVKDEIELRRKLDTGEKDFDDLFDIRELAKKVENFNNPKKKLEVVKDEQERINSDDRTAK